MEDVLHVSRKLAEGFVEVVQLGENTNGCDDKKDIGRRVRELVVAPEREFQGDAEGFDRHDGD